jgi:hypothetical protein
MRSSIHASPLTGLALFFALAACGRTEPVRGLAFSLSTADGGTGSDGGVCVSTCTSAPSVVSGTPFQTLSSGVPLHWLSCQGCVRVTVDPEIGDQLGFCKNVVQIWNVTIARGLCFSTVEIAPADPNELHRIHVVKGPDTIVVSNPDGTLQKGLVGLGTNVTELTRNFGAALGLATSTDPNNSVMSSNSTLTAPGPFDQNALRALYGAPAWCER